MKKRRGNHGIHGKHGIKEGKKPLHTRKRATEYTEYTEEEKVFPFPCNPRIPWFKMGIAYMKFEQESYRIRGAIFEVYREMGCGFLEAVYQECLEKELSRSNIPFVSQQGLSLFYKGERLDQTYQPDFICFDKIIVEIKAVSELADIHRAQVRNYLKASGYGLGLLVNFGCYPGVDIERIVL